MGRKISRNTSGFVFLVFRDSIFLGSVLLRVAGFPSESYVGNTDCIIFREGNNLRSYMYIIQDERLHVG